MITTPDSDLVSSGDLISGLEVHVENSLISSDRADWTDDRSVGRLSSTSSELPA